MGSHVVYVIASMTVLTVTAIGVARERLGVPDAACMVAILPTVAVGTGLALGALSLFGLDLFAVPAGVGVVVFALAGFVVIAD